MHFFITAASRASFRPTVVLETGGLLAAGSVLVIPSATRNSRDSCGSASPSDEVAIKGKLTVASWTIDGDKVIKINLELNGESYRVALRTPAAITRITTSALSMSVDGC